MTPVTRQTLTGIGVSNGLASGTVVHMPTLIEEPPAGFRLAPRDDHAAQAARISVAVRQVTEELQAASQQAEGDAADVLSATAAIAADPTLAADAERRVNSEHLVPERAVWEAAAEIAEQFKSIGGYLAERAHDIDDVRDRLIAALTGRPAPGVPDHPEPFILVALDLAPSTTATLDPERVLGIITDGAGPTSHTAIVANAKGIPAVVGASGASERLPAGATVLLNGATGLIILSPTEEELSTAESLAGQVRTFEGPGQTKDGHRVQMLANIGDPGEAAAAAESGAEGVGLFRSEFCFLDREDPPSVDEQVKAYRRVLREFSGKKVVIRTLDSGADKPLLFLPSGQEENPALGVRGLRTAKQWPELLDTQLEAIARAAAQESAEVWVMAPMVSTVEETEDFVAACNSHRLEEVGVMIEVPSAALLSGPILARATFASIGTNDLAQYAMAADRLLGSLAELSDPWQPAVLQLIASACKGGDLQGRPVGVCGEAASHPALATVLVGLGVSSLSMTPRAIPDVAAALGAVTLQDCREAATIAVAAESAADAQASVRARLPQLADLGL